MIATAVPAGLEAGWVAALGVGLVVAIVLVGLLHSLLRQVRGIEAAFEAAWGMGKQVARNTATTWMLGQTARLVGEIKDEALKHDALLSALLSKDAG
ncbi:MAG: hypothetical protein ABJC60_04160 [Actinomycetota bacterium]